MLKENDKLAIIGGSLLGHPQDVFDRVDGIDYDSAATPYGETSSPLYLARAAGRDIVYLNRHGMKHTIAPHRVNYRANIHALKERGVTHIIATAAVGGIAGGMKPLVCVIPDQLIDYTFNREQSFYSIMDTEVAHIDFSWPFDDALRQALCEAAAGAGVEHQRQATYGVTQGPRLETAAEIRRMERDGCDIVGMTAMPEAALAREAGMRYATCAMVVNRAAGKGENGAGLSMDDIRQALGQSAGILSRVVTELFHRL